MHAATMMTTRLIVLPTACCKWGQKAAGRRSRGKRHVSGVQRVRAFRKAVNRKGWTVNKNYANCGTAVLGGNALRLGLLPNTVKNVADTPLPSSGNITAWHCT